MGKETEKTSVVGIADMKIGRDGERLVTYALGSCLGLIVYDPQARIGGLLHTMLPASQINPEKAEKNPYMFVDTGIPALFDALEAAGAQLSRLVIKAAGCGEPLNTGQIFEIGRRNYTLMKKVLWRNNLLIAAEDVGGAQSRTVQLCVATGRVVVRTGEKETEL